MNYEGGHISKISCRICMMCVCKRVCLSYFCSNFSLLNICMWYYLWKQGRVSKIRSHYGFCFFFLTVMSVFVISDTSICTSFLYTRCSQLQFFLNLYIWNSLLCTYFCGIQINKIQFSVRPEKYNMTQETACVYCDQVSLHNAAPSNLIICTLVI